MAKNTRAKKKYVDFKGRMVILGLGSITQGVLPLILRHVGIKPKQITIIAAEDRGGIPEVERFGIEFIRVNERLVGPLTLAHMIALGLVLAGVVALMQSAPVAAPATGRARGRSVK